MNIRDGAEYKLMLIFGASIILVQYLMQYFDLKYLEVKFIITSLLFAIFFNILLACISSI